VLLAHADHPLAEHDSIRLPALAHIPLLLPPTGTALRRIIDRACGAVDTSLTAQAEIDGVRLLASLAFEGYGAAIVPATAIASWLEGNFKLITVPELPRRVVGWVQRKRPTPSAPTKALLEVLREVIGKQGELQPGVHVGADAFPFGTDRLG
jgi:DNA-binding transcriptional LysR family regulator